MEHLTKSHNVLNELNKELNLIRTKKAFMASKFVDVRTDKFLMYLEKFGLKTVVISVSGGIDSACVLGLLKEAQNKANKIPNHPFNVKNGGRIIAIAQPIYSTPTIQSRAYEVGSKFGIEIKTICQDLIHSKLTELIAGEFGEPLSNFSSSMLKSYLRTPVAYSLASNYSGIVVGTGNLDEDGYLNYYCKFGDGAADVGLIWDLHKSEVFEVARYLGVPESILNAPPSADLYSDQTDEGEIGVSYDMVELVYNWLMVFTKKEQEQFKSRISEDAWKLFISYMDIVESIHEKGLHKADLKKNIGQYKF